MKLPPKLGPIHFIGIGGIGMSGIAEVMHNLGYTVQGSDASDNYNVKRLAEKGIRTFVGHEADNVDGAEVVVVSTAIKRDNPELAAAREKRLPVVRRAEMLAELMRFKSCVAIAGTHGKTTTTSLVATLLDAGGLDPTVINGGIINAYGTNARMGEGQWMVVEADESDGTFLKLPADVAIVTNIDPEHLDHFRTFDAIKDAFRTFIDNIPFYGFAVMCIDHPVVQDMVGGIEDRRVITYGENPQADVRLTDVDLRGGLGRFRIHIRDRKRGDHRDRRPDDADARSSQRPQRHGGGRRRARARRLGRRDPQGLGGLRRRQAPLHPYRRLERRRRLRRLRPSPGRDQRRAQGGARLDGRAGDRGGAAAPLHAPAGALQRLLHLLQRCRRGRRRAGLRGRRAADPGRRPRQPGGGAEGARPPQCDGPGKIGGSGRSRQRAGAAGRLRDLPRRRQHHAMGLRSAGERAAGPRRRKAA